ncbi:MAG: type II secretion system protein GspD [Opitutaceae bacterium]
MKKQNILYSLLLTPFVLWAQADVATTSEIDLSDVVVIEDATAPANIPAVVVVPETPVGGVEMDKAVPSIPSVTTEMPSGTEVVLEIPGQEKMGVAPVMNSEETISVDFPDEDVRTILRNVADLFDLNLVIPETLQGRTSLKLSNVTWNQVFEVVLDELGFTYVEDRNIIRIKSIEELTAEPVDTRVFIVNYATASELQGSVAPLIDTAAGGQIQVDARSNALVITERPSRMNRIQEIIEHLDKPTHQVMIESKFIEITNTDVKNIGVNWASLSSYNVTAGPYERDWFRGRGALSESIISDTQNESFSSGSGLSFSESTGVTESLSRLAETTRLDTALFSADQFELIMSALKTQDDVKLVSNPTVVTLNNTNAKISIGERYPLPKYDFNAQTGERQLTDIEYEDIGINLDVTPHVNAAGFINLEIIPEVSSTDRFALVENTEIPIIESRRTETNIMVKDGFTLAIGGLVEDSVINRDTNVPVLSGIPGLGRLFRSEADTVAQRNLVIFITAKTLNPDGSTYKDVVDPRVFDRMGLVPSELPGYELNHSEQSALDTLEDYRVQATVDEEELARNARINTYEELKKRKEMAAEYEKMQEENEVRSNNRTRNNR